MSLTINLFSGPGAGKTTTAAKVFAALKDLGLNVEMALEYAKDLTWEGHKVALECQPMVTGTQIWRIERLIKAGVDIIITDSPPLLGAAYSDAYPGLREVVENFHQFYPTLNFFLKRVKPYHQAGRNQSEIEAQAVDAKVLDILNWNRVQYEILPGNTEGAEMIVAATLAHINPNA